MKLVLFGDEFRLGVLNGDMVVDASSVGNSIDSHTPQEMMSKLIEDFDQYRGALEQLSSGQGTSVSQVRLRAPLPRPARLVCMAGNYMESGTRTEAAPINAFNKSSSSVVGTGDTVVLPNAPATVFEHEAELGIVIGKKASAIKADQAFDHIFGYVNFIDVSCRGAGPANRDSFFIGKSWDTFGPMGPCLVTADEAGDGQNLPIKLWVDGVLRQEYNTSDMAHRIPEMLEWMTWITTMEPGDVIACGTNHRGLGPLQDGETVEMEIGSFGKLTVKIADATKRTWVKETHAEREAKEAAAS